MKMLTLAFVGIVAFTHLTYTGLAHAETPVFEGCWVGTAMATGVAEYGYPDAPTTCQKFALRIAKVEEGKYEIHHDCLSGEKPEGWYAYGAFYRKATAKLVEDYLVYSAHNFEASTGVNTKIQEIGHALHVVSTRFDDDVKGFFTQSGLLMPGKGLDACKMPE